MNNSDQDWDRKFSEYERDFDSLPAETVPADDFDFSEFNSNQEIPANPPEQASTVVEEEPLQQLSDNEQPEELPEEQPEVPEVKTHETTPHKQRPMSTYDMVQLLMKVRETKEQILPLRDQTQRMVTMQGDNIRLPKGLRSTASMLNDITDVFIATEALIYLYLGLRVTPLYQSVDDNKLKTTSTNTMRTLKAHVSTMQEGLNDVESVMAEGYDRPSANLRIRIVKAQAKTAHGMATQQAQALAQTIDHFPLEYGALKLLCLIEEKGDKTVMDSIDHTMKIAEHVQVPVADAPAMLQAVEANDQKAVDAIVKRMIQNS